MALIRSGILTGGLVMVLLSSLGLAHAVAGLRSSERQEAQAEPAAPVASPSPSVETLLEQLRGDDAAARARAARALADVDPTDEVVQAVEGATADEDEAVQKAATAALALLRPDPDHSIDQPAKPLKTPKARYPPDAFVTKFEGTVVVEILINSQGKVVRAEVKKSIPGRLSKQMDEAALAAARQWTFEPAMSHGVPVAERREVPFVFEIF